MKKKLFEPGEMVSSITGQAGMVITVSEFEEIKGMLKEKKRPGYFFAAGCCHQPDYIIQVPVLFEDGTYDVMKSVNIKKAFEISNEKRKQIQSILDKNW